MKTFRCQQCGGRFPDTASEDELRAEFRAHFPELTDAEFNHDAGVVELCSRCYREFMTWFRTLTEAQKREMREGYALGRRMRDQSQRAQGIQ